MNKNIQIYSIELQPLFKEKSDTGLEVYITDSEVINEVEDGIGEEAFPLISNIEALLEVEKLNEQSDDLQLSNNELKLLKNLKRRIKLIQVNR